MIDISLVIYASAFVLGFTLSFVLFVIIGYLAINDKKQPFKFVKYDGSKLDN